jgi:DNA-binding beta-propeller fold protein YncE
MRRGIRFALLAVALALALPGGAMGFEALSSFGEFGSGVGQMRAPAQVAIGAEGDVYVADSGNDRVSVYSGGGAFLRSFGEGRLDEPQDIALDDDGRAFVADSGNHRIAVFSSTGAFLDSFGEAGEGELVDPTGVDVDASMFGATVFVADRGNDLIASYAPDGKFLDSFGAVAAPSDVVVGAGGNLFVADSGDEEVDVFSKGGEGPLRSIGATGPGKLSGPIALAVDESGGIYVADQVAQRLVHFTADGAFLGSFAAKPNVAGVGVGCGSNVFAVERDTSLARVQRFGEAGALPPPCSPAEPKPEPIVDPFQKPPSNRFYFASLVKNRSNGYAVLYVRVPGPGRLKLTGRGFRRLSRSARQATTVGLPIKPKVRLRHFLRKHGKGRIRVAVTFTPIDGESRSLEMVVVLRRHRS